MPKINYLEITVFLLLFQYMKSDECSSTECEKYTEYESYRNCIYQNLINNSGCKEPTVSSVCLNKTCCNITCESLCTTKDCKVSCEKSCIETLPKEIEKNETATTTNKSILKILEETTTFQPFDKESEKYIPLNDQESGKLPEKCCDIIGAKKCAVSRVYPFIRCHHTRKQKCGPICISSILHEKTQEICDITAQGLKCFKRTIFIPQPKPRCFYHPIWPYVVCKLQQTICCEGCYQHYNEIDPRFYSTQHCSFGCYDDGFGIGPYYRKGPFYRPGYFHTPSCYQTGFCNNYNRFESNIPLSGAGYPQFTYQEAPGEVGVQNREVEKELNWQYNIYDQSGVPSVIDYAPKDVWIETIITEKNNSQATINIDLAEEK